jgi:hypothetical protein
MMHIRARSAAIVGLLLAVAAAGCSSLFGPSGPRIQVSLIVQQSAVGVSSLTVDVGGHSVSLRAADTVGKRVDAILEAPEYGSQPVQVHLLTSAGDSLAAVAFSQSFQRRWTYGIGAVVSRVRPFGACVGTIRATALRTSPADTLFVMFGGLPSGAVC